MAGSLGISKQTIITSHSVSFLIYKRMAQSYQVQDVMDYVSHVSILTERSLIVSTTGSHPESNSYTRRNRTRIFTPKVSKPSPPQIFLIIAPENTHLISKVETPQDPSSPKQVARTTSTLRIRSSTIKV